MKRREEDIYASALDVSPSERSAFLDRACSGDASLRARVEALLQGNDEADAFFEPLAPPRPVALPEEKPGDRIGRYKLLQKIGEGGCGVVYMAEQEEPVRRRVALKVIKLGMDTKEVIARFEAERQALALMDHPNIARVLDAGATETGRPFFVMELVRGVPITRFCDEQNLATAERLPLFVAVCLAIQHAHEKGIIHRDIKPSNILVTMHDDVAVPKVIDFGIAKATQGRLTDRTVFTAFEQFIGTPAYMSPEQAQMNDLEVDTRSDIYSLGVLLYELLTGRPPFDPRTLQRSGIDEIRRIIREEEPPRPSTRFNTLEAAERTAIARQRSTAPAHLTTIVRGDLDWIAMKAIEKNRLRRYATASDFAADIKRHLRSEPVVARPPNPVYRTRKFAARHRFALVASLAVTVALVAGIGLARIIFREQKVTPQNVAKENVRPVFESRVEPAAAATTLRQLGMAKFPGTWGPKSVSLDGRYFLYEGGRESQAEITLFDTQSQALRKLARANRGARFSADSTQVAFINSERDADAAEFHVIRLDGTAVRKIATFSRATLDYIRLFAWSRDGGQFAVVTRKDGVHTVSLVDAKDGTIRVLRTTGTRQPNHVEFSPDGRWLVYDAAVDEKGANTDLFVVAVATGSEVALVQHKSDDRLLGWSPRSDAILFTSNRRGNFDAWMITCRDGKAVGEPTLVKRDLGEPEPIGFTNQGAFYFAHREWVQDVYTLPLDKETGRASGPPVKAVDRFEGTNSAATWSPDGRKLAYSSRQPPFLIRLLDPATQEDHVVAEGFYGPKWSPDGKTLLCFSQWDGDEKKLHLVDVATGRSTMIDDGKPAGRLFRSYQWAPEGGAIYYQYGINEKPWPTTIVRRDLMTNSEREVQRSEGGGFFAVSPDGRSVVFRTDGKLHVKPVAGGESKIIYEIPKGHYLPGWDVFTWSATGDAVFACVWKLNREAEHLSENVTSELVRVPIEGGAAETILAMTRVRYPHAHPDGTRLTFSAGTPRHELWVMENFLHAAETPAPRPSGTPSTAPSSVAVTIRQVPLSLRSRWLMSVSENGKYLAYAPGDTFDLAVYEIENRRSWTVAQGTREKSVESGGVFSPDGQLIAYEIAGEAIYVSRFDGSGTRKVHAWDQAKEEDWTEPLSWSADGAELIFGSWFKNEPPIIRGIRISTGTMRQISVRPRGAGPDTWRIAPDQRAVARRRGNYPRMITLLDLQTGHEETLVERDADRIVGWVPGASRLVYSRMRAGSADLYAVDVKDGRTSGEARLLWSNWSGGSAVPLGITADGRIFFTLMKERTLPSELWVMEGFLPASRGTEAWRIQTEIPPDEILAPANGILDRKLRFGATYPAAWSIKTAVRQASGGNVIEFAVPGQREARARIIYWPAMPWENADNPANDFSRAGPKPTTHEEIDAWMRRRAELGGSGRIQGGYSDYKHAPTGYVSRTLNERPALSWQSPFQRGDQPWVEIFTLVYGEDVIANISLQSMTSRVDAIRPEFDQLVESVRVP